MLPEAHSAYITDQANRIVNLQKLNKLPAIKSMPCIANNWFPASFCLRDELCLAICSAKRQYNNDLSVKRTSGVSSKKIQWFCKTLIFTLTPNAVRVVNSVLSKSYGRRNPRATQAGFNPKIPEFLKTLS